MLDLWSGLFAALVGAVIGVGGSIVGAVIAGRIMVAQQERDFRRRVDAALRALVVEIEGNKGLVFGMIARPPDAVLLRTRLRRSMWDSQLPFIADRLEPADVEAIDRAYRNVDALIRDPSTSPRNDVLSSTMEFLGHAAATVRRAAGLPKQPGS